MDGPVITALIHGESGVGKTWTGVTTPAPRLILDVEGRSRFTPTKKGTWNPLAAPPTEVEETTIVPVRDLATLQAAFQWLASGQHPWKSVTIDSITELQKRTMDEVVGQRQPETQDWGTLLRRMEALIRAFRDLTNHPTNPLEMVVFIAMSIVKDDKYRPHLQGQISTTLPYYVDLLLYQYVADDGHRYILTQPREAGGGSKGFAAKDATGILPTVLEDCNLTNMLAMIKEKFGL